MKRNGLLDRVNREKEAAMIQTHRFTRQLMVDLSYGAGNCGRTGRWLGSVRCFPRSG